MEERRPTDAAALDRLAAELYDSLRGLARRALGRANGGLDPTDLVHQAWLRLPDSVGDLTRVQFLALSATVMRRLAVDEARRAAQRGRPEDRVTLTGISAAPEAPPFDMLGLDEALVRLQAVDERWARIVELRFFGGLKEHEVAATLGLSRKTVSRDWALARAWLKKELGG